MIVPSSICIIDNLMKWTSTLRVNHVSFKAKSGQIFDEHSKNEHLRKLARFKDIYFPCVVWDMFSLKKHSLNFS